jgi:DNA-binding GntR family transcriptional regulator
MPRSERPLAELDRRALQALERSLTPREVAARLGAGQLPTKGALGRLRQRGLVSDDGGRPPAFRRTREGDAALQALLDAA